MQVRTSQYWYLYLTQVYWATWHCKNDTAALTSYNRQSVVICRSTVEMPTYANNTSSLSVSTTIIQYTACFIQFTNLCCIINCPPGVTESVHMHILNRICMCGIRYTILENCISTNYTIEIILPLYFWLNYFYLKHLYSEF